MPRETVSPGEPEVLQDSLPEKSDDAFFANFHRSLLQNFLFLSSGFLSLFTPIVNVVLLLGWIVTYFGLFGLGFVFKFLSLIGLGRVISRFTKSFAEGQSMVQWGNLSLYDLKDDSQLPEFASYFAALKQARGSASYETSIAKALLLFSGLVYENRTLIEEVAQRWGFEIGNTLAGPGATAAQIFWIGDSQKHESKSRGGKKTIIVVFRGTNPLDLSEWLVDINLLKTDGRPYLHGDVHSGFLGRLFKRHCLHKHESLHVNLVNEINKIAQPVNGGRASGRRLGVGSEGEEDVKLWITGHSLGAALATLFYARLIKSGSDVPGARLVGAYTFGCPRTADYDFVMNAITDEKNVLNETSPYQRNIWRVVNANDIVPRVPFGLGFLPDSLRKDFTHGLLDYYHFGKKIQLHYTKPAAPFHHSPILCAVSHLLSLFQDYRWHYGWLSDIKAAIAKAKWANALSYLIPYFVSDHAPAFYFRNLDNVVAAQE